MRGVNAVLELRVRHFDGGPASPPTGDDVPPITRTQVICARLARDRGQWERLSAKLSQLSPLGVLERGYAIVTNQAGVVRDASSAPAGSQIHVRLHRGALDASVLSD